MNTILTLFGDVTYGRTYYKHKGTREYLHLLDDQIAFRKKRRGSIPSWKPWFLRRPQSSPTRKRGEKSFPKIRNVLSVLRW